MNPGKADMLTVKQAAERLAVSGQTVRRWIGQGLFPNATKGPGKRGAYHVPQGDVEALLGSISRGGEGHAPTGLARAMVIEDDPDASEIIRVILEDMGVTTMAIHSGSSAMTWIEAIHPDIVILDLALPGVNGRTILQHIRSSPQLKAVPVIVITANIGNAELMEGVEEMADLILVKPVYYEALQGQVAKFLGGRLRGG